MKYGLCTVNRLRTTGGCVLRTTARTLDTLTQMVVTTTTTRTTLMALRSAPLLSDRVIQ